MLTTSESPRVTFLKVTHKKKNIETEGEKYLGLFQWAWEREGGKDFLVSFLCLKSPQLQVSAMQMAQRPHIQLIKTNTSRETRDSAHPLD